MVHAHAALPRFQPDPKRILATSGVIALHAAVLMMLMMPVQMAQTAPDTDEYTPPDVAQVEIRRIEPPIDRKKPLPLTPVVPVQTQVAIREEVVEPVDQSVGALDTQAVDLTETPTTFGAQAEVSPFVQLATIAAPAPPYPKSAEQRRISGTVTLRIHVDAAGLPIEVLVENSSGSAVLDQAALKTVKARWRFVPASSGGAPIDAWAMVPIAFVLD